MTGMRWVELPNGAAVSVQEDEEVAVVTVVFTDADEHPRELPISLNGRTIERVVVRGAGTEEKMDEYLEGFEVMERPGRGFKSRMGKTLMAFLESGNECMGKRYEDEAQLRKDVYSTRDAIKACQLADVAVSKRGDMLILMRTAD